MKKEEPKAEVSLLNPIRVETALSRYPVHRLAKKGEIAIDLQERDGRGETTLRWRVTYNSGFGQPGPLAYKLDTLVINRRIEEASRPIPEIIRLGSLRDICRELGLNEGQATKNVKEALHQNASAYITAKTTYRASNGTERSIELGDTRYGIIFTGQKLPDGRQADAVYIVLHDSYREILDSAITRPLDYDYLKSLPPAPQRFYEILSYQMYAALKHDRARAKLVYSELCSHAPLTRHLDWDKVRSQMNKVHRPHRVSGYIEQVDFHKTTDGSGRPDWEINYKPGFKARAEYHAFTKRSNPVTLEPAALPLFPAPSVFRPSPTEAALVAHGMSATVAGELVGQHGEEAVALQVEHLEWLMEKTPGKVAEPGAWLRTAITHGITPPKSFVSKAERERRAEAKRQKDAAAAAARQRQRLQKEAEEAERLAVQSYYESLTPAQLAQLEADAVAEASEDAKRFLQDPAMRRSWKTITLGLAREHIARLLRAGKVTVEPA